MVQGSAPAYGQLLTEARRLGLADGRFAAAFEPPGTSAPCGERCLGRTPAEFARLLWEGRPGRPPVGLVVNAPLWYAAGFREGLAGGAPRRSPAPSALRFRRVFS